MTAGKIIAIIIAGILLFFGVLVMLAAFSPDTANQWGTLVSGGIISSIGLVIIWLTLRATSSGSQSSSQNVTLQVDLPASVKLEKFKCTNCGNPITAKDIIMIAGAPTVNCPYCGQIYQLTEEPKW